MLTGFVDAYWAPYALLPTGLARDVRIEVEGSRLVGVQPDVVPGAATRLPGVVLPGSANTHSHAFHRALRGRTHEPSGDGDSFWTWREQMYHLAAVLTPDSYYALARAVYAEMVSAGYTSVGEFHYLHHAPDGRRYDDPNAMGLALQAAAREAGIRLTLLDTCYLSADVSGAALTGTQLRFSDRDGEHWADRLRALIAQTPVGTTRVGAAIHSVRAVPKDQLPTVVAAAQGLPLHVHLSEQPAENEQCLAVHGCTPTRLLHEAGALGPSTTAVHATHLTGGDIALLGGASAHISMCPTTERDLADGIGPARSLADAGATIALGSDQHTVVDPFEEARALELDERLATGVRGRFTQSELLAALTDHAAIGWEQAALRPGAVADLVAVRLDSPRTAGCDPVQVLMAATASDVDTVLVGGQVVVRGGQHRLGDVGRLLADAIAPLWEQP